MADIAWMVAVVGGPIVLAAAFIYALMRRRKLTRQEVRAGEQGARRVYHKSDDHRA